MEKCRDERLYFPRCHSTSLLNNPTIYYLQKASMKTIKTVLFSGTFIPYPVITEETVLVYFPVQSLQVDFRSSTRRLTGPFRHRPCSHTPTISDSLFAAQCLLFLLKDFISLFKRATFN